MTAGPREPESLEWLAARVGRHLPAPLVFVESGTMYGRTTRLALELARSNPWGQALAFRDVHTIELSPELVAQYHPDLRSLGAICHAGDSREIVPRLAAEIAEPVFWYLDAHFWIEGSGLVAQSPLPLLQELEAIARRPWADVVMVDDVACFGGTEPEPAWAEISIERIEEMFPRHAREVVVLGDQLLIYQSGRLQVSGFDLDVDASGWITGSGTIRPGSEEERLILEGDPQAQPPLGKIRAP